MVCCQAGTSSATVAGRRCGFIGGLLSGLMADTSITRERRQSNTMNGSLGSARGPSEARRGEIMRAPSPRISDRRSSPPWRQVVNSLVQVHMPATYFGVYQELRGELMAILSDDDLAVRVGGTSASLGALCREIGEIEHAYVESFRTFRRDFDYRNPDPLLEKSVGALASWYAELDRELTAAVAALSEE